MVALNESFAVKNPSLGCENRVGDFFGQDLKTSRVNQLSAQQPRLENGHGYDETASGMFYYGFRYYDPETGRWPSRDKILCSQPVSKPLGFTGESNSQSM